MPYLLATPGAPARHCREEVEVDMEVVEPETVGDEHSHSCTSMASMFASESVFHRPSIQTGYRYTRALKFPMGPHELQDTLSKQKKT